MSICGTIRSRLRPASSRYVGILAGTAVIATVAALAGVMPVTTATAGVTASDGWSRPRALPAPPDAAEYPGLSCPSRSVCTVAGIAADRSQRQRFFVATERQGTWGKPLDIATPTVGKMILFGGFPVLSCASAGNCAVGDEYSTPSEIGNFVVSETHGKWGKARTVPGTPEAISCPAAGDCTAALRNGDLISEQHGTWHKAFPVPGLAALRHGGFPMFEGISCPAPGNCAAAGNIDHTSTVQAFVVTERHGIWGRAQLIKSRLKTDLFLSALSCPKAGNCVVAGSAVNQANDDEAFTVAQAHGIWGTALPLPGTSKQGASISQLACPAVGTCTAIGTFGVSLPFMSAENNGTWHTASAIAGARSGSTLNWLACPAVGDCVIAGAIVVHRKLQAATVTQVSGRWSPAKVLPGMLAVDHGLQSQIQALSCPVNARCAAIGSYGAFVAGQLFFTAQR